MDVLEVMAELFGGHFVGPTWQPWRVLLAGLFGLRLEGSDLELFRRCTGRSAPPTSPAREGWLVIGRRGGKSLIAALVVVYLACFRDHRPHLAPGERGTVMVIAADRRQARTVLRYIRSLLEVPLLRRLIERETRESIDLTNGVTLEVHTASYRRVRGYTVLAGVLDEVAFWPTEDSAEPDTEVVNALRPAMATVPDALLLGISSPYARRGVLWQSYERHFGKDGGALVWRAPTRVMNPTVPEQLVACALEEDPEAAAAEYLAEFRRDVESFVSREAVDTCVVPGRIELPPVDGVHYVAFCDPSGGASDSMTLAIAHTEDEGARVVLDCVRERRPPFSPDDVVAEFAATLGLYRRSRVMGDRYGGGWPTERFQAHGITYQPAEKTKSDLYREFLPALNSSRVELLDHPRLHAQLLALERKTARGGRDSIDHGPNRHDDVANAVAGALVSLLGGRPSWDLGITIGGWSGDVRDL